MKYKVTIEDVDSIDEIPNKWSHEDYVALLDLYEYGAAGNLSDSDIKELLYLSITEFEPQEAAAMLLKYKLGDDFNDGQIEQISNDMLKENVSEHYSDISYHSRLFDINVLLYKAFNGKFPHAKASVITLAIVPASDHDIAMDAALLLRCILPLIDEHALIKRLFVNQVNGEEPFEDAANIAWYLTDKGNHVYELITSDYWISDQDFITRSMDVTVAI